MGKVLRFPRRAVAAALTLVTAAIVFVLFVPIASGGDGTGTGTVTGYGNKKGKPTRKVQDDQWFYVFGSNLSHVVYGDYGVWCWDQTDNTWLMVSEWEYSPVSKALYVDANNGCVGNNSAIGVDFADGGYAVGPRLTIT